MARKKKHEEHENHERWLVSYADFITLLFAFFVVMYSVSSVNEGKYRVLSDAIVAAFQQSQRSLKPIQVGKAARSPQSANLEFEDTANPIKVPEGPLRLPSRANKNEGDNKEDEADFSEFPMAEERMMQEGDGSDDGMGSSNQNGLAEAQLSSLADEIAAAMQPLIDRDLISVKRNKRWIEVEINTSILFTSGSAKMQEQSLPVLEALSHILSAFPNDMRVEGFTDNLPIKSQVYPSNWELSAARAASVVRLFSKEGILPERMAAIGYGEFRPIASNDTLEGRIKNRRVVVVITANRHMKRPQPIVKKKPQPIVKKKSSTSEKMSDVGAGEVAGSNDSLRLDALVESSGLHRTKPFVLDEQKSPIAPHHELIITPPIRLRSPIILPSANVDGQLPAPASTIIGGE